MLSHSQVLHSLTRMKKLGYDYVCDIPAHLSGMETAGHDCVGDIRKCLCIIIEHLNGLHEVSRHIFANLLQLPSIRDQGILIWVTWVTWVKLVDCLFQGQSLCLWHFEPQPHAT